MSNPDKYKIEVKWDRWNVQTIKKDVIPLPVDKVTGISWEALVKVIADNGIEIVDEIRLHNVGQKGGTSKMGREELFRLWKCVEASRPKNQPNKISSYA
jgi:hypothetical protein